MLYKFTLLIFTTLLSVLISTTNVFAAPSFNCKLARSTAEKLICANEDIARLDVKLSIAYKAAKSRVKNMQFSIEGKETPASWFKKNSNREWRWRERNCKNKKCLQRWYVKRQALMEWIAYSEISMSDFGINRVEQIDNNSVIITFETATYQGNVFYDAHSENFQKMPNGKIQILSKSPLIYKVKDQKSYFNGGGAFWYTTIRNQKHQIITFGQQGAECMKRKQFISSTGFTAKSLSQADFEIICVSR